VESTPKQRRRVGETVYTRTFAGPIVRVRVTEVFDGGFKGTVHPDDDRRTYLAGVPECPPGYVSVFFEHCVVTREEFEKEDWTKWISRIEKKKRKS
jgi:hypothetical protein